MASIKPRALHKKGAWAVQSIVKTVGILLVFGILLAMLINFFSFGASEEKQLLECKVTIGAENIASATFDVANQFDNTCRTTRVTLPEKGDSNLDFYHDLATRIARTWWVTHEGTIENLWKKEGILAKAKRGITGPEQGCVTMYVIRTTSDVSFFETVSFDEFRTYMQKTEYLTEKDPELGEDVVYSYWSYVENYAGTGAVYLPIEGNSFTHKESGRNDPAIGYDLAPTRNYAISVVSPTTTGIGSRRAKNTVVLSSLEFARTIGCDIRAPQDEVSVLA